VSRRIRPLALLIFIYYYFYSGDNAPPFGVTLAPLLP